MKNNILSSFPFYPLLCGLYPVLYLWSVNRTQEPSYVVLPSLVTTLMVISIVFLFNNILFRNIHRASLVTLIFLLYVLTYGHLKSIVLEYFPTLSEQFLFYGSLVIYVYFLLFVLLFTRPGIKLTKILNTVSAIMLLFPLLTASSYYMTVSVKANSLISDESQELTFPFASDQKPRDIYFILLDNYGREDVLLDKSGFDNREFIQALKDRGFLLPNCAQANYFHTAPDISAILNMDYLDEFGIADTVYSKRSGYSKMTPLLMDSKVMEKFKTYGYHTVTFRGFMGLIDIQTSDTYINFEQDKARTQRLETKNFSNLYFETTLLSSINKIYKIYPDLIMNEGPDFIKQYLPEDLPLEERFEQVYLQNLYSFEALERIPTEIKSPKFVYAHLYSAHWPFMMKPDGSLRLPFSEKMTVEGYIDGVKFTNQRILEAIDTILASSETKPIIILQGDHSDGWEGKVEWSGKDRLKILSAYYLPDGGSEMLYDTISPVNNFRLVFRYYFGENVGLLQDEWRYLDRTTKTVQMAPKTCISSNTD